MTSIPDKPLDRYTEADWIDEYRRGGELPPGVDVEVSRSHPQWRLDRTDPDRLDSEVWRRGFDGLERIQMPCTVASKAAELEDILGRAERDHPSRGSHHEVVEASDEGAAVLPSRRHEGGLVLADRAELGTIPHGSVEVRLDGDDNRREL